MTMQTVFTREDVLAYIARNVKKDSGPAGCLLWQRTVNNRGYPLMSLKALNEFGFNRVSLGHRVLYRLTHGPIPAGMTVDHVCFNPACMNIVHLELVTRRENSQRSWIQRRHAKAKP